MPKISEVQPLIIAENLSFIAIFVLEIFKIVLIKMMKKTVKKTLEGVLFQSSDALRGYSEVGCKERERERDLKWQ